MEFFRPLVSRLDKRIITLVLENESKTDQEFTFLKPKDIFNYESELPEGCSIKFLQGSYKMDILLRAVGRKMILSNIQYKIKELDSGVEESQKQFEEGIVFGYAGMGSVMFNTLLPLESMVKPDQMDKSGGLLPDVFKLSSEAFKYTLDIDSYVQMIVKAGQRITFTFDMCYEDENSK